MKKVLLLFALFCCISFKVMSQDTPPKTSSFISDYLSDIKQAEDKVEALAEAIPEDKYNWRPADGIRSISEVYMHIVGGNFFILSSLGAKMPEGFKQDMEKSVTKKSEVLKWLKDSYKAISDFVPTMKEDELGQQVKLFNTELSKRMVLFIIMNHSHEHLGQSIAYARSNGITPPWSMKTN